MDLEQLRQAGFNDGQINEYVLRKTTTLQAAGFSDEEINSHLGITLPDQFFPVKQEANSVLQRVRNYLGIPTEERKYGTQKVYDPFKQPKSGEVVYGEAQDYADAEILRVMDKFVSGVSGGISDLIFGRAEKPETVAGTIAGAGAELAGFIVGPVKASKFLLGSRLAPTATGLKKMAQILTHGGAQLGIASGLSSIIPSFLESKDFADMGLNILESTSMGALTGMIYPAMGVVPTKLLRMAATLAVMDKIRAGTGQWFTLDDFITGLKDGTVDKKELSQMAFGYLMDLYFAAKTPSIRTQLKSLEGIGAKIRELDPDETAQAVLDIVNNDSIDQRIRTLGLNRAVQYDGKTYPAEPGEIHVQIIDRNGLPINEKVKDGYIDKEGNFHGREEVVAPLRDGEGIQGEKVRESLPVGELLGKESPLEMTLKYGPEKEMAQAGTEAMIEKGIVRDPKKLMTEQLVDEWLADPSKYQEITAKYGMTPQEFASAMKEQASSWGRKLGELGLEAQRLGMKVPELGEALAELEKINRTPGAWDSLQNYYKSFDRIRRGLLVTQLSTSVRNFETQLGRVGLDVFEKGLDSGLQKLLGKTQTVSPLEGVEQLFKVFQRGESKKIAETVLEVFPKEYKRMYSNYMSDIETGIGGTLSRGVDILNTANRFQEFLFRNGVFRASLEQNLRAQGKDPIKIIERNGVGEIPMESIRYAVDRSLEMTFAKPPEYGTIGQKFVSFVNGMPGATFLIPFPRFLLNSLKFTFEYNPTGLLKLLSAKERAAFAAGDMHVMSRAIIGTAMLGVSYLLRDSEEYAGEKWYELNAGGKTIDLRPFNPFAAYLFMADVVHKSIHGNLQSLTAKDITMGILSSNMRAGTGLFALDQILNALSKTGDSEKALDLLKQITGEVAGGFLTPLNQFKEFLAGFDDYVVKEKRSDPFWGPIKEKIPWLEKTLPELYSPTKEGPVTREKPALRQLTGIMAKTKTDFEKELDRLGFDYREIVHSTGNAEADNLVAQYMGIMASRVALPLVQSEGYQNLPDEQKAYYLRDVLAEMREFGKGMAEGKDPLLFAELQIKKIPKRERAFYESIGIDFDKIIDQYRQMRKGQK
jgi:hypothetical protein